MRVNPKAWSMAKTKADQFNRGGERKKWRKALGRL